MKSSFCVLLTICFATEAHAFEISTPVSHSCHEDLTLDAQRSARFPEPAEAPTPTEDQRRAMNDLVFALPNDDAWSLALFIGVRSNDLGSNAPTNLDGLFHVHDDPAQQPAHCIRRQEDDGPAGDTAALAACREFILGELEAGGLLDDTVDLDVTEQVESYFRFRGVYEIALPRFAYRLGRAAHAMQDVYTHTMRDAETGAVRHVLNWIDAFGGSSYDQAKDGYPHLSGLDDCLRDDTHQTLRINRARQSSIDMFAAITRPGANRRERVTAVVDAALVLMPGCDASNNYCDAPELGEPTEIRSFGCSVPGAPGAATLLVIGLIVLGGRRRKQLLLGASTLAIVMLGIGAPTAHAQSPTPAPQPAPAPAPAPAPETDVPVAAEAAAAAPESAPAPAQTGPEATALADVDSSDVWHTDHWHFDARLGGAIDDAGLGASVGIGRTQNRWTYGFLAEWNPWFSFDRVSVRPGVLNAYLTLSYRWFQGTRLTIATRIEAGTSTMLFELLGLDKYTTGLYLGGALATIRFPLSRDVALTFDPVHFALPAPRPFGLPFYYKQYRVSFGIEVRL